MFDQECQGRNRSLIPWITWRDQGLVGQCYHASIDRRYIDIILIALWGGKGSLIWGHIRVDVSGKTIRPILFRFREWSGSELQCAEFL
jgi:hypothetical protein